MNTNPFADYTVSATVTAKALGPPSIRKQTQINTFNTYTKHTSITQQQTAHLLNIYSDRDGNRAPGGLYFVWNTRRHTVTQIRRGDKLRGDISVIRVV